MILSKNAVGNLINRYKAVLGKCRLLNTFGSLALAAALTLGSAGLAVADVTSDEPGYWTGEVTVDTPITVSTPFTEGPEGQNITAASIALKAGGKLTLQNGARLINGVPGEAGDAPERLAFTMTGGALTLGGDNYADDGINASINAKSVNISGGTVDITGKDTAANWYQAAQIGGYRGLTISGGIVNMNSYSQLFGGGTVGAQFTGGTINMLGDSTATAVGNSAAHIMFGGAGDNLIAGTAAINVGSDTKTGYGVMTTGAKVNMTGGSINVQDGKLLLQPDVNDNAGNTSIIYSGDATGAFNQTGGTVTIADAGTMTLNKGMTYTLGAGGTLTNNGTIQVTDAKLDLTGAALEKFSGTAGTIAVERDQDTTSNQMARVDMTDTQLAAWLDEDGAVTVKGNGTLHARLHLGENAELDAGSITGGSSAVEGKVALLGRGSIQAQNMTLTGNALDIGNAETTHNRIKVNSLTLDPGAADADFTLTSGKLYLKGEAGSALNLGGNGALVITDLQGKLELGEDANPGGSINANVTSNGTVKVAQGKWTLAQGKTLDIASGSLTVSGTLDVTPGALKTASTVTTAEITSGGTVLASKGALGITDDFTDSNLKKTLAVAGGGTLKVDGLGELDLSDIGTLKNSLMAGNGLFDVGNATITGIDPTGGTVDYTNVSALDNTTSDALRNATVTDVTADLSGAYAEVKLGSTFSDPLVDDNTTLQLTGANGGNIVSDSNGDAADVTVAGTGTLVLGDADSNNSGTVGDVTLAGTGSLQAVGNGSGNFTVGDISGASGTITASGATLNAQSVAVDSLSAVSGTVSAATITAATLDADNGTVRADGNITATNTTLTNNGVIQSAAGAVTLTNGLANGNGSVLAGVNIAADGKDLTVANGKTLSLVAGTEIKAANITATNVQATTLTATGDVTVANGTLTTTGTDADVSSAGTLTLTDSKAVLGDMDVTGTTDVTGGSIAASGLTVGADSTFTNGAQVTVGSLDAAGNTMTVGSASDTKSTSMVAETLILGGGSLLIDPDWTADGPNTVAALTIGGANIDGNVGVGQNSLLTIGDTSSAWLTEQVNAATNGAGLTPGGVTAALGLKEAQVLGDNTGTGYSLVVNGALDNTGLTAALGAANTATFADNSLLVVTAAAASAPAGALSATTATTATIGDSAKLRITDAKVGKTYTVLGNNMTAVPGVAGTGWTGSNFSTDSRMINGSFDATTGVLSTALNSAANVYPKLDGELVKVLDNAYTADQVGPAHVDSDVKGVRFLSRATSDNFIGGNADLAAKTIESAARIAVAGAVPQMTMAASNAAGAAITQRTSIAQPDGNGMQSVSLDKTDGVNKKGMALWIMPLYQSQNAWSMEAGNNYDLKWHGGLGGVALGGDYTFDNALRAGIAFNIGGGYAEGEGDLAKTTNSFNFWGLGAYAGWAVENFGLTADVNYTSTYNKVKQELPGAMQMRDLKSDITAYALSTGLRAEYKLNTQYVDIIPHLGVRYMYVNTNSYDVKSNGTVMHGDEMNQNIWTFPIGVTFSKQVETGSGWYVKPSLDLGVIPATGDIEAKSKIRFTGTGTKAELDTHTMDYMSYTGGLGLDFGNDNLSLGVNYNIQASEHSTSHGVFGTVRYEF